MVWRLTDEHGSINTRDPALRIFGSLVTRVIESRHVYIFGWYDSERDSPAVSSALPS